MQLLSKMFIWFSFQKFIFKFIGGFGIALLMSAMTGLADEPTLNLAGRRELFVDNYLIQSMRDVELRLNAPRDEGEVLRFDQPWEGLFCTYSTIIKDGAKYLLYYRGKDSGTDGKGEVTCYAESNDGLVWNKPKLGLAASPRQTA